MIRVPQIRLIDEEGNQMGIIDTNKALIMAKERNLSLVEVSPNAQPPVCRIIDWGKFQYEKSKKEKDNKKKQRKVEIKGIRLRPSTGENDLEFKLKQTEGFLSKGHRLKIEIILRGRENFFKDEAKENLKKFIDKIKIPFKIEQDITKQGRGFMILIAPDK